MLFLKQSTAVELKLGPFLDNADGFTPLTSLTISQADVRLAKEAGDWAQKNESTSMVHEENGWYRCLLDATDTNTLGRLKLAINESGALPVWEDFVVLVANVYDSLIGNTDKLEVDLLQIGGDAQSATDLKDFADAGYDPGTNKVQGVVLVDTLTTYTGNTPQTGDAFARLGAPAGASVSADVAAVSTLATAIKVKTDQMVFTIANKLDSALNDANSFAQAAADKVWSTAARTLTAFGFSVTVGTNNDKTGYGLSATAVDDVWDEVIEGTTTARQSMRLANSANGGKTNGAGTGTFNVRDLADTKNRVQATIDVNKNRTAVTRDLT